MDEVEWLERARLQGQPRHRPPPGRRERRQALPLVGGAARDARLRDRRRRRQGRRAGALARARRRRPRAALGDRLEVPADDRDDEDDARSSGTSAAPATWSRSRCWSRSTSAASPSPPRPSTTRRTWRARTSASGDEVVVMRAGDVIPQVVSPKSAAQEQERPQTEAAEEMPGLRDADGQARGRGVHDLPQPLRLSRASPSSTSSTSSARGRWTSTGWGRSRRCASSRTA